MHAVASQPMKKPGESYDKIAVAVVCEKKKQERKSVSKGT